MEKARDTRLFTVGASIDMAAFNKVRDTRPILRKTYAHPYYLAFGAILVGLAFTQAIVNIWPHLPEEEPSGNRLADVKTVRAVASAHAMDFRLGILADRNDQRAGRLLEISTTSEIGTYPAACRSGSWDLRIRRIAQGFKWPTCSATKFDCSYRTFSMEAEATLPNGPVRYHVWSSRTAQTRSTSFTSMRGGYIRGQLVESQRRGDVRSVIDNMADNWSLAAWLAAREASAQ